MRLERYGIQLETLNHDHLEMVRLWRNQDFVRTNMQFKEILSRADQERWFNSLDPDRNLYWVIRSDDYPIGLIHIKDIDLSLSKGEAGIFIGEPSYLEMPQPMLARLLMMELAFSVLNLKILLAKIKNGNTHAIVFNEQLGYQLIPDQPEGFQYYRVDSARFDQMTHKLRISSAKMFGGSTVLFQPSNGKGLQLELVSRIVSSPGDWMIIGPSA